MTSEEEAEFSAMVLRQSRFVFRVAYVVLLNVQDAEDAAQETFLKLYRNGGWRYIENERAFLARAAWRVALDSRRQHGVAGRVEPAGPEGANAAEDLPAREPSPEMAAVDADQEALLHAMIDALPEDLRLPLVLSAFDGLNSREIGGILSIPEGTARTRIQRARQMLRQKLGALQSHQEARYVP